MASYSIRVFLLPLLLALLAHVVVGQQTEYGTVYYSSASNSYKLVVGVYDLSGASAAAYEPTQNSTGWDVLTVVTNTSYPDSVQMYAAGYVEGALTWRALWNHAQNINSYFYGTSPVPPVVADFITTQASWVTQQIAANPTDPIWIQVSNVMSQFQGLMDGYAAVAPSSYALTWMDFNTLQLAGDLLDLIPAIDPSKRPNIDNMTAHELQRYMAKNSHCSALVKLTYDFSDLFAGHSSWFTYSAMNRMFKNYQLNLTAPFIAARKMTFSSYPGFLVSLDDFYQMDSGLVMLETSNSILNDSLYSLVVPQNLFTWQRVRVANALSNGGQEWCNIISQHNSGTYNNQYMLIDYKLFTPGQPLTSDTLWVCEQIPGLVVSGDITRELERGMFPSYNIPYFEEIYNISGYPAMVAKYGPSFSYQLAARAQIFRRDHNKVVDLDSFKAILRYNDYKNDPVSGGDTFSTICSRGDLATPKDGGGCIDTKVTSVSLHSALQSHAINGPTTNGGMYPPFAWNSQTNKLGSHIGEPSVFDFPFLEVQPNWDQVSAASDSPSTKLVDIDIA